MHSGCDPGSKVSVGVYGLSAHEKIIYNVQQWSSLLYCKVETCVTYGGSKAFTGSQEAACYMFSGRPQKVLVMSSRGFSVLVCQNCI